MLENSCLRPATVSDVPMEVSEREKKIWAEHNWIRWATRKVGLETLYDAEWKKRAFERSP